MAKKRRQKIQRARAGDRQEIPQASSVEIILNTPGRARIGAIHAFRNPIFAERAWEAARDVCRLAGTILERGIRAGAAKKLAELLREIRTDG